MATTPNGVPYPTGVNVPDVPFWLQQMAEYIDGAYGDTGWLTVSYGTGWSDFSTSHRVRARRIGKVCHMKGAVTRAATGQLTDVLTLPPGLAPGDGQEFLGGHTMSSAASYEMITTATGLVTFAYPQGSLPATGGAWPVSATWMAA